ncbi:MAG TPA: hypothetical protein VFY88_02210 [Intrasporangium sp.]|nr:hypothetical protein [Intrasporangium sp.]
MTSRQRTAAPGTASRSSMSALDRRSRRPLAAFPHTLAHELAQRRVDLHEILELVGPGSPPDLAARTLSRMDTENRSGTQP